MALTPEQAEQVRQKLLEQIEKMPAEQAAGLKEQVMAATPEQIEAYLRPQAGGAGAEGGQGGGCLFCGIAQGKVDTIKVYEGRDVVAFLDITPAAAGQTIIVPKEHYQFLFQVPDQTLWELSKTMKTLIPLIVNATSAHGLSVYMAQGHAAGQNMDHLSINLVPRFDEDKAMFAWDRKQAEKKDLDEVAQKIIFGVEKTIREEREAMEKKMREKMEEDKAKASEKPQEFPRRVPR